MDKFLEQLAEIFEEDQVNPDDKLVDFDAWDSLTQLSIIALTDEEYGVTISAMELREAETIGGIKKLIERKKA
jgi:acyl carrier protein